MAYFAHGTEGDILHEQCANCPLGYGWNDPDQKHLFDIDAVPRPCPVALVQLTYNYSQIRGPGCEKAATILERLGSDFPEADQPELGTAIKWLRSDDFKDAMNLLINEQGECQVRKQLVEIRREGGE